MTGDEFLITATAARAASCCARQLESFSIDQGECRQIAARPGVGDS